MTDTAPTLDDDGAWPEVVKIPGADQAAAAAAGVVAQEAREPGQPAPLFSAPAVDKPAPPPAAPMVCRDPKCRAEIRMAQTEKGRRMPVDAEPNPDGNLVWVKTDQGWRMRVLGDRSPADPGERRFMAHWKTCQSPDAFRRREKLKPAAAPAVELFGAAGMDLEPVRDADVPPARRTVVREQPPGGDLVTLVTRESAPTLAEVGADQDEQTRTCPSCGAVCPAAMPALWGGALVLLDAERGMYDQLAVLVGKTWRVRPVGDNEPPLPYWNRRGSHRCPAHTRTCQTPGHEKEPASLTAGGAFCRGCLASRESGRNR